MAKTFVFFKPDAIERKLKGNIIQMIEDAGFSILDETKVKVTKDLILTHYLEVIERLKSHDFIDAIEREFVGQEIECLELEDDHPDTVQRFRDLLGATNPAIASSNTIRGRYGADSYEEATKENRVIRNLMHASGDEPSYIKERALWFDQEGILSAFDFNF
jgi:nucleoside-diphosphate kinase